MASVGALKTLMTMLAAAPSMVGVSLAFGEEALRAQEYTLPMVTLVPIGGSWGAGLPGYAQDTDVDLENIWMTSEAINLVLWANANMEADPPPTAVDHADAVENLRSNVLRALQSQAALGLKFVPVNGQWSLFDEQVNRFGRGYTLTVNVDITYPSALPVGVTLEEIIINPSVDD